MSKIKEKKQEVILSLLNITISDNSVLYIFMYKKYNATTARKDIALKEDAVCYPDYNKALIFFPSFPAKHKFVLSQLHLHMCVCVCVCIHIFFFWLGFL